MYEAPLRVPGLALEVGVARLEAAGLEGSLVRGAVHAEDATVGRFHERERPAGHGIGIESPEIALDAGSARVLEEILERTRVLTLRSGEEVTLDCLAV